MNRRTLLAIAFVALALGGIAFWMLRTIRHDRERLVSEFARERLAAVQEVAREIEADLDDVAEALRFAGQLVRVANDAADRERELRALLAAVKRYRSVSVFDGSGAAILTVTDPLSAETFSSAEFMEAMAQAAHEAMRQVRGTTVSSAAIPLDFARSYRAFAVRLPGDGVGAVAVLVETSLSFGKLGFVADAPGTRLLVLGPRDEVLPTSDRDLAEELAQAPAGSPRGILARRLRESATGVLLLDKGEAVAAHVPIESAAGRWAVALVTSTESLQARERAVVVRIVLASGAIAMCLVAFAIYVVASSRRTIALRERLRHADALAHLHEKAEKILDNVPGGVIVLSEDGRVTGVNRALRGTIPPAALGEPLARGFPGAPSVLVTRLRSLIDGALVSGRVKSIVAESLALFGQEGQYSIHAVPLEPHFPDARSLLVIEDVSEVRALASQLLRAEKLATVGILAAGIAHEVGTPLGVVRARAELMAGRLGEGHPQAPAARVIVEQIDRVTRTLRQLLDFSRVKPSDVGSVELEPVIRCVSELLRFESEKRKTTLALELEPDLPRLAADADELQQVLVNLVFNACDACDGRPGGRITIRAGRDQAEAGQAWRMVRLQVIDGGCGIPAELQHQVFDPFFTTKKRGQGTGLGLTIAAQIVRNHGGRIDLVSDPDRGTTVTVRWPAVAGAQGARHAGL